MFDVNNSVISKKFFGEIITRGIAKEETTKAVKLLVNMSEVSKAWLELSRALILNLLNSRDWSLKDIVVLREKKEYPFLPISDYSYTTLETDSLVCFFKIFGRNLNKKPLIDEGKYAKEIDELLSYYAPKLWDFTKEIEELEKYVTTLDPDVRDEIIERFREASRTRVLDILDEGILEWFSDMDLDSTTKTKITELNIKISNYLKKNLSLIKNLNNIYLRNFCGFKTPYEEKGWETALSDFVNYLSDFPDKELTKKILKTFSEGSGNGDFDFLIPLSTWVKDLNIPVKIKLRLFELENEIKWEMERLCKDDEAFKNFWMSLIAKLISLNT